MSDFIIPAECHTDDFAVEVPFDALKWFKEASDQEILDLAECEWRGDYPADAVAQTSSTWNKELDKVFDHTNPHKDLGGFECSVDEGKALEWLLINKPELHAKIESSL